MKFLKYIILLLITISVAGQNISGTIVNNHLNPVTYTSISLENTNYKTETNENGYFQFTKVKAGNYTLVVTAKNGLVTRQNIFLDKKNIKLNLNLDNNTNQLQEIVITGVSKSTQDRASSYSSRLPLKNIENPQVSNQVSQKIIREQASVDLNTALQNVAGVKKGWASTNGYFTSRGFNTRSYMRNGIASFAAADLDFANLEELQVIKGPSGTLFGSALASFGGVINRITKKPLQEFRVEAGYLGGSYDFNRFTLDVNSSLSKNNNVLFRLNAAKHYTGSFQDSGFLNTIFVAPSIVYKVDENLSISLDAEYYSREGTSQPQITPTGPKLNSTGANHPAALPLEYKRSYSNNSITLNGPTYAIYGQINYRISNKWNSQTNLIRSTAENSGNYLTFNLLKGDSLLVRNISHYPDGKTSVSQIQQNFNGDFKIGRVRNRFLIGVDYYQNTSLNSSNALNGRAGRPSFDTLNIKQPMVNYNRISPEMIDARLASYIPVYRKSDMVTYAVYVSDVVNVTNQINILLGARIDRIINKGTTTISTGITSGEFNQTAISPKIGVVYEFLKDRMALFSNYMNGFQSVAPVNQPDGSLSVFKPQYANQFEIGMKTELVQDKLNASVSFYNIKVKNTLRPDVDLPTFTVQEGTQFSKGFEIDLNAKPVQGLFINAGFGLNKSEITSGNAAVNKLRPVNSGPEKSLNMYVSYNFHSTKLHGLGIGCGANYTGENLLINNNTAGQFYLDSYTLINAGVFYDKPAYRFAINVENLSNKEYYTGGFSSFTPGMLRKIIASFSIKF